MDHQSSQAEYSADATLADLIDVQAVQTTMDSFFALTNIGIGIIDLQGKVLVATGWQDICVNFHRMHPETCRHCRESDTELSAGVQPGEYKEYRCKNGMREIATPIFVEGKHLGNVFLGQFLLEDETPDYDCFRAAARQYGFAEADYLAALDRVPRWSRETVIRTMGFYKNFANLILSLSSSKRNLERLVNARTQELTAANEELSALNDELEHRVLEIEEKNLLLARSNADLEQFAYVASHDLQEPLRQIVSFTQLLARRYSGKLDTDADDFIRYTVDGTKRMQELINDILAYSRLRKSSDQFVSVDCEALLTEVLQSMQSVIEQNEAEIVHEKLPTVAGDRTQLAQLFRNLVGNAVKFRGSEAPRIQLTATRQQQHWLFAVSDNGIGIAPEYFDRIFVVFRRLHAAAEYPGTGIGLSICKRIVENHSGKIWLQSEPGKGTTFFFTLKEKGGSTMTFVDPIRILLVEDSPGDVRLTVEALKDGKVRNDLSVVGDGVEALAFLQREGKYADAPRPDLILLDLNLPRMDGRELLAIIKQDENLKRIPVVVLTTSEAEVDVLRVYDLNANCYITKPVDLDKFITVIKAIEDFWLTIVKLPRME